MAKEESKVKTRTRQNTINMTIGTTPREILEPNPKRKAFLFMPVAGRGGVGNIIAAQAFNAGAGQTFTVPQGVTQILDVYAWGAGGASGEPGVVLGGGGGGGGSFASLGALAVVPGTRYGIGVGAGGSGTPSTFLSPAAVTLLSAPAGVTAILDAAGAGGGAGTGTRTAAGGAGAAATALAGAGAGGGGGAGSFAVGAAGAASAGGAGGGAVTQSTYGVGGAGGAGGASTATGVVGAAPGGGAGGSGDNGPPAVMGAAGMVVVFYLMAEDALAISLSHRPDVTAGQGTMNYLPNGGVWPMMTDEEIGDAITLPWYIVSAVDGVPIQITEYSYDG